MTTMMATSEGSFVTVAPTTSTTEMLETLRSCKEELYREERDPTLRDSVHFARLLQMLDDKATDAAKSLNQPNQSKAVISVFDCDCCFNLLTKPVTLLCGHTFCENCVSLRMANGYCLDCSKFILPASVCVTSSELITKCFSSECNVQGLKALANSLIAKSEFQKAVDFYTEALLQAPHSAVIYSNRSFCFLLTNNYLEAVRDADKAILLAPRWSKGYWRKACALESLSKQSETVPEDVSSSLPTSITNHYSKHTILLCSQLQNLLHAFILHKQDSQIRAKLMESIADVLLSDANDPEDLISQLIDFTFDLSTILNPRDETRETKMIQTLNAWLQKEPDALNCPLCFELLYQPCTTTCGHTMCKQCLARALDHKNTCPYCRAPLDDYLQTHAHAVDIAIETLIKTCFPQQYEERKIATERELQDEENIPIFVCSLLLPSIPCPLHIFEPRYRLMIRRSIESGQKRFGMIPYLPSGMAEYGTMAEIRSQELLPDGRSLIDTIGGKRFKILSSKMRDGYLVARIEWIEDTDLDDPTIEPLYQELLQNAQTFLQNVGARNREKLLHAFGPIPTDSAEHFSWWYEEVMSHENKFAAYQALASTSLKERLERLKSTRSLSNCSIM